MAAINNLKINIREANRQDSKQDDDQTQTSFCYFCNKKAEFKCGLCLEATYCTPQHQKADWPSHRQKCTRPEDKLKNLQKVLQNQKKIFFDKLAKGLKVQCQSICENILKVSEQIAIKFPNPQHQIEYGTAICCYVKMLLSVRSFNVAQQILLNYLKQKDSFLRDTSHIPQKIKPQNIRFDQIIKFVEGKLKLLSVLCNLAHQTVRNSVYMVQILINHCSKFYGPDSLQVSNAYFELANYYFYFMNQNMKACACYLIAGKIRKSKGLCSFFNAALILMKAGSYNKSIKFLQKCLQMITQNGDTNNLIDRIYLALAYCFKKLNHFDNTVRYLQKGLCQLNIKHRTNNKEQSYIRQLLKLLGEEYKNQFSSDQVLSLPKQRQIQNPQIIISHSNLQDYWDLDADNTKKKKSEQWIKSFKNQDLKTTFQTKVPMTNPLVEKVLFHNYFLDDKNDENQNLSLSINKNSSSNIPEYINVDLQFMSKLTSAEVRYMNQLNRLLVINKDKPTLNDIIQNSNLIQSLSKDKIQRFYQLNPQLLRQKQDYNLIDQEQEKPMPQKKSTKPSNQALKLDLNRINKNK